jgi:hypothetical protein
MVIVEDDVRLIAAVSHFGGSETLFTGLCVEWCTVPFRPGVQSLVTSDLELNTRYVLSRVTRPIEQRAKEITEIYQKYLLQ